MYPWSIHCSNLLVEHAAKFKCDASLNIHTLDMLGGSEIENHECSWTNSRRRRR
jgi:hypothetical protein